MPIRTEAGQVQSAVDNASEWAAIVSIAAKIGCTAQTLSNWVRQAARDAGKRPGLTTDELCAEVGDGVKG